MKYKVRTKKRDYILVENEMGWWLKTRSMDVWVGRNLSDAMKVIRRLARIKKRGKLAQLVQSVIETLKEW